MGRRSVLGILFSILALFLLAGCPQQAGKCGDGICDDFEKANLDVCPVDCNVSCPGIAQPAPNMVNECKAKNGTIQPVYGQDNCIAKYACSAQAANETAVEYYKNPFGAHPAFISINHTMEKNRKQPSEADLDYTYGLDLGLGWNRPGYYLFWNLIQKTDSDLENGNFNWSENDFLYASNPEEMNLFVNIGGMEIRMTEPHTFTFKSKYYEDKYTEFVKAAVERYDGDGIDDAPNLKNPVKYYQLDNEPDIRGLAKGDWKGYANLLKITYDAVKSSCSDCKVAIGGWSQGIRGWRDFYSPIISKLEGNYVDIFDFHYFGFETWKRVPEQIKIIQQEFAKYGKEPEIWVTETGTYTGTPCSQPPGMNKTICLPSQTEKQQAESLVIRMAYSLAKGVKKVFWAWSIMDGPFGGTYESEFSYTGLVYGGWAGNDPGYGVKKLSYYSYKLLIEKLKGSDWDNVEAVVDGMDNVYVYKFMKKDSGKPVWVAWNDNTSSKQMTISGISSSQLKITEAVPDYASGKEINDYGAAFKTEIKTVQNGELTFALGDTPVFLEEG